ncbi:MAG: histidine kinase, partial [Psychrobium sp.]|nr:histidine kinase [Psychrobium sp.]
NDLNLANELICKIMTDIRRIYHQLPHGVLEDYGLGAALEELGQEFSPRTGIKVEVIRLSVRNILST